MRELGALLSIEDLSESAMSAIDAPSDAPSDEARLRKMVSQHLDFTWRSLRRLGLSPDLADDATQRVFLVASRRLADIPADCERAFLFNTALRVASSERRTIARRREVLSADATPEDRADGAPLADELVDRRKARAILEELLDGLPIELRAVFVLCELEGMTVPEIARTLDAPEGTVSSRLRRARQGFEAAVRRRQARAAHRGGGR